MSFVIPAEKFYESSTVVAFAHPKPSYKVHILIVPKKEIRSLLDIQDDDKDLLIEIARVVQYLIERFNLSNEGYRVIVNGGNYQEVEILHFHLVSS